MRGAELASLGVSVLLGLTLGNALPSVSFTQADSDGLGLVPSGDPYVAGVYLKQFDASRIVLKGNVVDEGDAGVFASRLSETVRWALLTNDFRTEREYDADPSVAREPEREAT